LQVDNNPQISGRSVSCNSAQKPTSENRIRGANEIASRGAAVGADRSHRVSQERSRRASQERRVNTNGEPPKSYKRGVVPK